MINMLLKRKLRRDKGKDEMIIKDAKRMSNTLDTTVWKHTETYTLSTYLDVLLSELVHLQQRKTETNTQKQTCTHKAAGNYTNMLSVSHALIHTHPLAGPVLGYEELIPVYTVVEMGVWLTLASCRSVYKGTESKHTTIWAILSTYI